MKLGGFYNAHAHIDRAGTLEPRYLTHVNTTPLDISTATLRAKQDGVGDLERGEAYTEANLRERMRREFERQIAFGTRKIDTCIDATPEIAEDGLLAIRIARELKDEFVGRLEIGIAPHGVFGFKDDTRRWEIYKEAANEADFLSALPEKDDFLHVSSREGKIGFRSHVRRVIELGASLGKRVDLHLDQMNSPHESGTEILLEGLGRNPVDTWLNVPKMPDGSPGLRAVHFISPSAYAEERFARLLDFLEAHNIGVTVPPSAGISMRQLRPIVAPTHNSIARVLELVKREIPVYLGTDNICDMFVPAGDGDMLTEVKIAAHAVRFYTPSIWAKIACGDSLNNTDRERVGRALYQDKKVFLEHDQNWQPAVD